MAINTEKTREWKSGSTPETGTPALGELFNAEFDRLYENDRCLKDGSGIDDDAITSRHLDDVIQIATLSVTNDPETGAGVGNRDYLDARYLESLGHENLVYNPHQQYILCDTPGNPDGYIFSCDGTAPAIVEDGDGSVRITVPSDATMMTYSQKVDEVPGLLARLRGKQVSFRVVLKTAAAGAEVVVDDGVGTTVQAVAGTGSEEIITITRSIDATATMVKIMVRKASAGGTINIYRMEGNVGFRAVPGLPCVVKTIIGEYRSLPRAKVPVGQLHRNGASLSTTTYSRLFSVIKYEYGGSGGNFNVPDFRGWFERGWANGQATDPDRASRTDRGDGTTGDAVGTEQLDAIILHKHNVTTQGYWWAQGNAGGAAICYYNISGSISRDSGNPLSVDTSTESRARNKNVLMTIVYA